MEKTDTIAILGYGIEGRAMCEYLLRHGFRDITVCDQNVDLVDVPDGVAVRLGDEYLSRLAKFDVVFRSPGISYFRRELVELVESGSQTVITSMTKYFFEHCRCPIIGVTGTKGKGTTASLITDMLRRDGRKVFLGGNIGVPAVSFLDELSEDSVVVLELSSFQLVDLEMSPHIAVVLNVTSEHLDYHSSVEEYHESKYPIVAFQGDGDFAVMNADYPYISEFAPLTVAAVEYVSCKKKDFNGAWVGSISENDALQVCHLGSNGSGQMSILPVSEIGLLGRHNWENVLPAVVVARILGVSDEIIARSLREFRGLSHRLELVAEANGVSFYNDSFSTTPEACIAACNAFNDLGVPFFLIAGGSEKGSDFVSLGWKLSQMKFLQHVFLMGPAGVRIADAITSGHIACVEDGTVCRLPVEFTMVDGLGAAVEMAALEAKEMVRSGAGGVGKAVVLMSPAAASFNEFKNYKERGEKFREVVLRIS